MTDETDAPGQPATPRRLGKRRPDPGHITQAAHDSLDVSRAFGPAYERDDVRVIPVARVMGATSSGYAGGSLAGGAGGTAGRTGSAGDEGADGGEGADGADGADGAGRTDLADGHSGTSRRRRPGIDASGNGDGYGGGGGFGTAVKPLGVIVIDDSGTHWQPTIDVNRAILGGQVVLTVAVLTAGWILARRHTTVHRLGLPALPSLPVLPHFMHHRAGRS